MHAKVIKALHSIRLYDVSACATLASHAGNVQVNKTSIFDVARALIQHTAHSLALFVLDTCFQAITPC